MTAGTLAPSSMAPLGEAELPVTHVAVAAPGPAATPPPPPDRSSFWGWFILALMMGAGVAGYLMIKHKPLSDIEAARLASEAGRLAEQGLADASTEKLHEVLRLRPAHRAARWQLANAELRSGNTELALLHFKTYTELNPEDGAGWTALAGLLQSAWMQYDAEAAADRALALDPDNAEARTLRARARYRLGRYQGALLDAEIAVKQAPNSVSAWLLLSQTRTMFHGARHGADVADRALDFVGLDESILVHLARLLADQGLLTEAEPILKTAITAGSERAACDAQVVLARQALRKGNRPLARTQADAANKKCPADAEAAALAALIDVTDRNGEQALARLDATLELLPRSEVLRGLRTKIAASGGNALAMKYLLADWLKPLAPPKAGGAPENDRIMVAAGRRSSEAAQAGMAWVGRLAALRRNFNLASGRGDWPAAEAIVAAIERDYPATVLPGYFKGQLALAQNRLNVAELAFRDALVQGPRSSLALHGLAEVALRRHGPAYASNVMRRFAEDDAGFTFARDLAVRYALEAKQPDLAAALLKGMQHDAAAHATLAGLYLEQRRPADAQEVAEQGLKRWPEDIGLRLQLARARRSAGDTDNAVALYEHILARQPDHQEAAAELAYLLVSARDDQVSRLKAVSLVDQVERNAPTEPTVLNNIGLVHLKNGELERARGWLEASARTSPASPSLRYHLAEAYAHEGETELARRELRLALESGALFPELSEAQHLLQEVGAARLNTLE